MREKERDENQSLIGGREREKERQIEATSSTCRVVSGILL